MFGGKKFNRNSELLRDNGDDKSNVGNSIVSVNDTLFQQINDAENYAKQILKTGQSQYVDGIKQNILDAVRSWLQEDGDNIFTLYGKMGCGKSFFSARLYQDISAESELRNNKYSAADIKNAFVHFSVFILKDTQFGDFGGKQFRLRLAVALHNTEKNVIALADAAFDFTVNGNG